MTTAAYPHFIDEATETPACRGIDTALFFPEASDAATAAAAKAICRRCPLLAKCREYALNQSTTQIHGIWGGLSDNDRRRHHRGGPRRQPPGTGRHLHVIAQMRAQNPPASWTQIGKALGCSKSAVMNAWRYAQNKEMAA